MKGDYILLDEKIAMQFHQNAQVLTEYPNDYGRMTELKYELMQLCGVTELEAHNILIDRNVSDYIRKYKGINEGFQIETKKYEGDVQVIYKINEDERDIFEGYT